MHLKYAVEIAAVGSLNKAAENLYMGQPNLSRAIKELESSLGFTVFDRSAKGMTPTPAGEKFLKYAEKILHQVDEIENLYKSGVCQKQQLIFSAPGSDRISSVFAAFANKIGRNSSTRIVFDISDSAQTVKKICTGDADIGIIRYNSLHELFVTEMLKEKDISAETVFEFSSCIVMSKMHPLAEKEKLLLSDLSEYTEVHFTDDYQLIPDKITEITQPAELKPEKIVLFGAPLSIYEVLSKNTDFYVISEPLSENILSSFGLVQIKCTDISVIYKDALIKKNGVDSSALEKILTDELRRANTADTQ